jgi:hypothetical protein
MARRGPQGPRRSLAVSEDTFGKVVGRHASDEERQRLYRLRDALGLRDNDAFWSIVMALEYDDSFFRRYLAELAEHTERCIEDARAAFAAAAETEAAHDDPRREQQPGSGERRRRRGGRRRDAGLDVDRPALVGAETATAGRRLAPQLRDATAATRPTAAYRASTAAFRKDMAKRASSSCTSRNGRASTLQNSDG